MNQATLLRLVLAELERLGPEGQLPGFVTPSDPGSLEQLLSILHELPPGATWADLRRRLDPRWDPNAPIPYRPYGGWDHQTPPEEAVFHLQHATASADWVEALLKAAEAAGVPLHGGGRLEQPGGRHLGPDHGWVTVRRGLTEDQVWEVWAWLEAQPDVEVLGKSR